MKKLLLWAVSALVIISCDKNPKDAIAEKDMLKIRGKVKTSDTGFVVLTIATDSGVKSVDSVKLTGNTFELKVKAAEKSFYYLDFFKKQSVFLIGGPNDTLFVEADADSQMGKSSVKGTKDNDDLKKASELITGYQVEFNKLQQEYMQNLQMGKNKEAQDIADHLNTVYEQKILEAKKLINEMGPNLASMSLAANFISPKQDLLFLDTLAQKMQKSMPDSRYTKSFVDFVNKNKVLSIGSLAPDFTASTPEGKWVKLSDFKGKYILLDFWASWCGPCRQENPNVVKMYNKYKNKGFDILSFSLDENKEAWVEAIKQDGLAWTHVSELKKWDSKTSLMYQVEGIPATFLIDKEGKIIAKNLRGEALEAKLKELMK